MKRIDDPRRIEELWAASGVCRMFDTPDLTFQAFCFEKGEYLVAPGRRMDWLLFLVEGTVRIYGIRESGSLLPVDRLDSPALLGDLEFMEDGRSAFYAEACGKVICLALYVPAFRDALNRDLRFLHALLHAYADKIKLFSAMDLTAATIEDRVLLYMSTACPDHELRGIESAVLQLRCSRRQLQRVLQKLCAAGRVEKLGKGRYKLIDYPENSLDAKR